MSRIAQRARNLASQLYPLKDSGSGWMTRRKQHAAFCMGYMKGWSEAKRATLNRLMEENDDKVDSTG